MLYSYWKVGPEGLRSPKRPRAYHYREDAARALGPRARARGDCRLVCLLLRPDEGRVIPEFGVAALGQEWSMRAKVTSGDVLIYGEVPEALWYEER